MTEVEFSIGANYIGERHPTYFIADIGANHDGDLGRARDLVCMAKEAGANAAKFQHFKAETIVSHRGFEALGQKSSHQASWKSSVFDAYKKASINLEWTAELQAICNQVDIDFFTSPYAFDLVDHIDPFVPAHKIGSGDITWIELVEYIAGKNKPYILATGASSLEDVKRAVHAGLAINDKLALMQCNTNYTGSDNNFSHIQLNVLKSYKQLFPEVLLGLSDHTPGHSTVLGAVALGARMIEKHFTDNVNREGPDHKFSMDPKSWCEMVDRTRELEAALGDGTKRVEQNEEETVVLQRRCLRVTRDVASGEKVTHDLITPLRPCPIDGIEPYRSAEIVGCTLVRPLLSGEHIRWTDLK